MHSHTAHTPSTEKRTLLAATLLCLLLALPARDAAAVTRYVVAGSTLCSTITSTPCYGSIQAALNQSENGDALEIRPGVHTVGEVEVTMSLAAVYGINTAGTVLTGGGSSSAAILKFSNVAGPLIIHHLTFYNAGRGIEIANTASTIDIYNNIFELGSTSTAVSAAGTASPKIYNNTFYRNLIGMSANMSTLSIYSNIFYQNSNSTAISPASMLPAGILSNLFFDGTVGPTGINVDTTTTGYNILNEDPLFVAPDRATIAQRDFHLAAGSPAINTGYSSSGNDTVDNTAPDIGAYGGSQADTLPSAVTGVAASAPTATATSVTVSWSPNEDYRVTGYKVYYRLSTVPSATYIDPPGFVIGTTSTVISGLTASVGTPVQPVMNQPDPRNGTLILSWTTDTRATNYNVNYSLESAPTVTITIPNVGNVGSYTLSDLANLERYWISVTPLAQPAIFTAVTASYDARSGFLIGPGVGFESDYSTEARAAFGDLVTGPTSTPVLGIPEPITPYPNLPNTGCFIATAAYGSHDAPPVRMLRAFRDRVLLANGPGRAFTAWYYRTSPALAAWLNDHPALKPVVRLALEPVVAAATVLLYAPAFVIVFAAALLLPVRRFPWRRRSS